jgi:hypothetical protein
MDPDPDSTPDPTPFFNNLKDVKKFFFIFFSFNLFTGTSSLVFQIKFLLKFCVKILFCQALLQSAQHIYGKKERSGSGSGSVPLTNSSGWPKHMRILRIWIRLRIRIPNTRSQIFFGLSSMRCICAWGMISPKMTIQKNSIDRRDFWTVFYHSMLYLCLRNDLAKDKQNL